MIIKVLGACCKKSLETFENTKLAAASAGLSAEVESVSDDLKIARYGVMQTPALVVNEKVVSCGSFLKQKDAEALLKKALAL